MPPDSRPTSTDWLRGGGEMGGLIRAMDWARTPIGPIESWSPALRMMVRLLLANRFPLLLWWGPQYVSIYNDPYRPVLGAKHPWALGRPVSDCWSEIWHILQPLIDTPFKGGPATWNEDIFLEINRHGFSEETHFTIAYSPVPDESVPSGIGGVLATVHEITEKVIGERRVRILRDLGAKASEAKTAEEACSIAAATLARHGQDIPFVLFYLADPDHKQARLAGMAGIAAGEPAAPQIIDLAADDSPASVWPLAEVEKTESLFEFACLQSRLTDVPRGPWPDPPHTAVIVPIRSNKPHELAGFMVAGVSARLKLDELYRNFFELTATQIATAVANARAYEEERKRAEALEEIDRAKTAFFSNVSHEFRTPLTLMLGPIDEILVKPRDQVSPASLEALTVVQRNGQRLLKLVNTLLEFSRIEAGRVKANYEPADLAAVTAEVASNFRSACERAGIALEVDCPALDEPVYVDRDMWEKIVVNLLSNAFKFTFAGRITVVLRREDGRAVLTVRDTGTGIPHAELPHLFERFHRVEGARGRTHEGTGIGLALVHELVKLHGGSIGAVSEEGKGSAFEVELRFGSAHLPRDQIKAAGSPVAAGASAAAYVGEALSWLPGHHVIAEDFAAPESGAPQEPRQRVLLADDNADMREYLRRLLSSRYDIEAVADGVQALEAARLRPPQLILTDVMMPRLDGFGLLRALREDEHFKGVPVIMLSARAGEEARIEGLERGANDYIVKPFSARELLARIDAQLARGYLNRRTAQFETLVNQAPLGVYLVDADFRIRQVNPTALLAFGDMPDLIGRDFDEVIHILWPKAYADEIVRLFRHTLKTGEPHATSERVEQRLDRGVTEYYEWRIDRIPLPEGRYGVVCYFRDIFRQVLARTALAESAERYQSLVSIVTDVPWTTDASGAFATQQPAWAAYTGQSWEELRGFGWLQALHPEDRASVWARWEHARDSRTLYESDGRLWHASSGAYRHFVARATPVLNPDGSVREWAGSCTDVHERKQAEEALRQNQEQLRAALAASEKAHVALAQADRRKDEFMAMFAHELRNPLSALGMSAELLGRTRLEDKKARFAVPAIARQAKHLQRLADDLLDMARATYGKLILKKQPLDLMEVAKIVAQDYAARLRPAAIKVAGVAAWVDGDPVRVRQMVGNLLDNAIKYGGRKITIRTSHADACGQLSVADDGQGIEPGLLPDLFKPFVQGEQPLDRAAGGLGLGLALVDRLAALHGGQLSAQSDGLGKGSTFTISLPAPARRAAQPKKRSSAAKPRKRRVLVVEDEPDSLESLRLLLETDGHEVSFADNGRDGVAKLRSFRPHIALVDVGLPGMDGYEVARRARRLPGGKRIKLIAITGYGEEKDMQRAREAGFDLHVIKPVVYEQLVRIFRN